MIGELIESMSTPAIYVCLALLIMAACEIGFKIGNHHYRKREDRDAPTSIGPMVGGLLGMLAFVLAFVFSMAAAQYDLRRQNVLAEANAIHTAYLRADLIDEPHGAEIKRLLREYVGIRLQAAQGGDIKTAMAQSLQIHEGLWTQASAAARLDPGPSTSTMAQSIIDVIDMHEKRATAALHSRIPTSVWIGLMTITALTMITLGMQVGFNGKRRLVAVTPLSMAFAVLVALVVDLNRPQKGLITVSQRAMVDLQAAIGR
jgi:hypothetical protein